MKKYFLIFIFILILLCAGLFIRYRQISSLPVFTNQNVVSVQDTTNNLPLVFRGPSTDTQPHIVGAKIQRINIPNCDGCYADIITSMDGVSDTTITQINHSLSGYVFNDVDIRKSQNIKKLSNDISSIDMLESKILYIDKGIISFHLAHEFSVKETAHPARDPGSYYTLSINEDGKTFSSLLLFDEKYPYINKNKVLEHFYPNGKNLLVEHLKKTTDSNQDDYSCYEVTDFPEKFWPDFRPATNEVVFSVEFPYATIGVCHKELEIAIPLSDILKQVPQYVPKDSVLWKFSE